MKKFALLFIFLNIIILIDNYLSMRILDSAYSYFIISNDNKNTPAGTYERIEYSYNLSGAETKAKLNMTFSDDGYYYSVHKIEDESMGNMELYISGDYYYSLWNQKIKLFTKKVNFNKNEESNDKETINKIIFNNPQSPSINALAKLSLGDYTFKKERVFTLLFFDNTVCYIILKTDTTRCLKKTQVNKK